MPTLLERALIATRESRRIEFRERFDFDDDTVRDVAALASSGGGVILFGVDKHGDPTGAELPSVAQAQQRAFGVRRGSWVGSQPQMCWYDDRSSRSSPELGCGNRSLLFLQS